MHVPSLVQRIDLRSQANINGSSGIVYDNKGSWRWNLVFWWAGLMQTSNWVEILSACSIEIGLQTWGLAQGAKRFLCILEHLIKYSGGASSTLHLRIQWSYSNLRPSAEPELSSSRNFMMCRAKNRLLASFVIKSHKRRHGTRHPEKLTLPRTVVDIPMVSLVMHENHSNSIDHNSCELAAAILRSKWRVSGSPSDPSSILSFERNMLNESTT